MTEQTDKIEKRVFLRASRERVWRALSNAREFGEWFGVKLVGELVAGETIRGLITYPGYEHVELELDVVALQPQSYLAYRWHPHALEAPAVYAAEPKTLVEFELAEADGGCQLTIRETGFDKVPASRRATAFRMNDSGWTEQAENIARHVASS
jgi:uncharacterized protein YndB with AHSA1/START domain